MPHFVLNVQTSISCFLSLIFIVLDQRGFIVPKLPLEDGIHAAKMLIPRCYFDKSNCKVGLEALRHYHRAWNDRMKTFRNSPVHDFSSHASDAFRYLAVGIREGTGDARPRQHRAEMSYNPFEARL